MVVSIFYNRSSWHDLITSFIKPFIWQEQRNLQTYYIYFGTCQGDHITFAAKAYDNDKLQEIFSLLIGQFFLESPSETKAIEYPLKSFFIDYPNNSFYFNRKKILVRSLNSSMLAPIQQRVSKAVIHAFGNDVIDTEGIYTFIIYMQLGIIKAAYSTIKQACAGSINLLNYLENNEDLENKTEAQEYDHEDLKLLFDNNKEMLIEIIEEIWNPGNYSSELKWLEAWILNCKQFNNEYGFERSFVLQSELICEHVGYNSKRLPHLSLKLILNSFNHIYGNSN